mmetsp:Transcript_2176/g.4015  ORF Transcript_2176/g.4015 Transcript_2176/m.4015 type:complete len:133 (-) Transcript_2176:138-536(-)
MNAEEEEEERLVQEVLKEFPPEEKGEREEWNRHVGWHRQEDIRNRGQEQEDNKSNSDSKKQIPKTIIAGGEDGVGGDAKVTHSLRRKRLPSQTQDLNNPPSAPLLLTMLAALVLLGIFVSKVLRKRTKGRTL